MTYRPDLLRPPETCWDEIEARLAAAARYEAWRQRWPQRWLPRRVRLFIFSLGRD